MPLPDDWVEILDGLDPDNPAEGRLYQASDDGEVPSPPDDPPPDADDTTVPEGLSTIDELTGWVSKAEGRGVAAVATRAGAVYAMESVKKEPRPTLMGWLDSRMLQVE